MLKKILYCLITFFFCIGYVKAEGDNDINQFVQLLSKDATPTLSDYYRFYGHGAEEELQLVLNICERKGWTPALTHSKCMDYIKAREKNSEQIPSLFFAWIRIKLPVSPKLTIYKIERVSNREVLEHELIYASLDSVRVLFYRTINSKDLEQFGILGISQINSVSVEKLLKEDIKNKNIEIEK